MRRATLARLAGVAAALAVLATPGLAAAAGTIGAVGINDLRSDGILLPNEAWSGLDDLDMVSAAGVQLYRARMQLNCVDPGYSGSFNFASPSASCDGVSYDQLVLALAQRGMTLLPVLINYTNGSPLPPTTDGAGGSPTIAEFAAFAAAAVERYGPTGTFWSTCGCTPHPIEAWEIWNEENNGFWWDGDVSPTGYAQVFAATRDALRSVDPQALAVVGGLAFDANGQPSFVAPPAMINQMGGGGREGNRKGAGPAPGGGAPDGLNASDPIGGVTLFDAIEKQLGLKLEAHKEPRPVLVIDHIEPTPTEN